MFAWELLNSISKTNLIVFFSSWSDNIQCKADYPCEMYSVTVRILKEGQHQPKPRSPTLYFVHNEFAKIIFNSVKTKMEFCGGWGGGRLWKVSYINQAVRYFSRKILVPTPFSQIPFSIYYCHPCVQVDTSYKNIGTLKLLHCIHILHRKDYHIFSKATLNIP